MSSDLDEKEYMIDKWKDKLITLYDTSFNLYFHKTIHLLNIKYEPWYYVSNSQKLEILTGTHLQFPFYFHHLVLILEIKIPYWSPTSIAEKHTRDI